MRKRFPRLLLLAATAVGLLVALYMLLPGVGWQQMTALSPFDRLAARPFTLPVGGEWIDAGISHSLSSAHPLNEEAATAVDARLLPYESVYRASATVTGEADTFFLGYFVYAYADAKAADAALAAFTETMQTQMEETAVKLFSTPRQASVQGDGWQMIGEWDEAIYWFAGVEGNVLVLVMVDSLQPVGATAVLAAFQTVVAQLSE